MRQVYDYLVGLPSQCSQMTFEQLLFTAALITLVAGGFLMISGRERA